MIRYKKRKKEKQQNTPERKIGNPVNREKSRKWLVTIVTGIFLLVLYAVIFSFSAQDGEESGSLSALLSELCVGFLNAVSGKHWTEQFMGALASYFEHPIRKLAHFGEYAMMGVLVYILLRQWRDRSRRLYCVIIIWVFLSAASDELHQYFVPGRYSSFADVLLDTSGGIFGIWCMTILEKHIRKQKKEK